MNAGAVTLPRSPLIGYDHPATLSPDLIGLGRPLDDGSDVPRFQCWCLPAFSAPRSGTHNLVIWQGCPLRQVRVHLFQCTQVVDRQPDKPIVIARLRRAEMLRVVS